MTNFTVKKKKLEQVKCVVVGDGAVGKTCLVSTYVYNIFPEVYVAVFDNYIANVIVDGSAYELALYDTAGQEDYDSLRPLSYPSTDIFLLCFSITTPSSFKNITMKWYPEVTCHCPKTPSLLIGCKLDLREDEYTVKMLRNNDSKPITYEEGQSLAEQLPGVMGYYECSSLTKKGLQQVFNEAVCVGLTREPLPETKKRTCVVL